VSAFATWLRGLQLLADPGLVKDLAERRSRLAQIDLLRARCAGVRIAADVRLLGYDPDRLRLGGQVTLGEGTLLSFGDPANGFGEIAIGERTWVGQYNNLRAGGGRIEIGRDCLISQFCTLVASNHGTARSRPTIAQPPAEAPRGVTLGDDVWLGAGVAVLPGARIGHGAVIGANAVVAGEVPEYEIWAGVPARKIGERS
jgi:acetyltransferase-like isoleucine patch superfamily enzyme